MAICPGMARPKGRMRRRRWKWDLELVQVLEGIH